MEPVSHPLAAYRKRHSLTLEALAKLVGTSKATMSRIEKRRRTPSAEMLQRIYDATSGEITPNDCLNMKPKRAAKAKGLEAVA